MDFKKLEIVLETLSATADLTTIVLNLKKIKIPFNRKTFEEVRKDEYVISDILNECFNRKEVLWQHPNFEDINWCYNSLVELQVKCDEYCGKLLTVSNDKNYFLSQLLRIWGNNCNETCKDLYRSKNNTGYDISKSLHKFRIKTYPIIITLFQQLPDENLIKQDSLEKLELGCKNSKIRYYQIMPDWSIE